MDFLEAIILGLVQGASEFLPISSSGHLLLLEKLGIGEENLFFNICLHLGTLLAVIIALNKEIIPLIKKPFQKKTGFILLASVPTVAIALVFKYCFPALIGGSYLAVGFVFTACILFASEKLCSPKTAFLDNKISILTGVSQGIAALPGISRSGTTIATMRLLGLPKEEAASFSFLLSIPIIIGSAVLEGIDVAMTGGLANVNILPLLVGTFFAFVSGIISIKFFLKLIKNRSLLGFSAYTLILGIVTLFVI